MSEQVVLLCDEQGLFSGEYVSREAAHRGDGRRHLAIVVLLYNRSGQVLLQRRRHQLFDGLWDLTGATHVLHLDAGDESFEQATRRCLQREYGLTGVEPRVEGALTYFARDGAACENEHCAVLVAEYDGQLHLNDEVGYSCRWVDRAELEREIAQDPTRFSPWAVEAVRVLQRRQFFAPPAAPAPVHPR